MEAIINKKRVVVCVQNPRANEHLHTSQFDWLAYYEHDDTSGEHGHGATSLEAIKQLLAKDTGKNKL